ncbi:Dabb family protein [Belliella marina]|uniref:Dabb family protein n=1 Tax=Belliella marina TaxID=1644146 RepID=A0ABW4VN73_9BACT
MKSRRKFIKKVALVSATTSMPMVLMANQAVEDKMIHQVFFWLNEGEDVENFMREASVLGKCPTVAKFFIGQPAPTEARDVVDHSYQVACTLFFKSLEDQSAYQVEPKHLEFIERNSAKWNKVKVYDFMI